MSKDIFKTKMTELKDWTGPVMVEDPCISYYDSIEELLDDLEDYPIDDRPAIAYPCKINTFGRCLDASDVVESRCCELYEEAHYDIIDLEGLQTFLDEWCDKQTLKAYFADMSKFIKINYDLHKL
jgi:hypothetical protein